MGGALIRVGALNRDYTVPTIKTSFFHTEFSNAFISRPGTNFSLLEALSVRVSLTDLRD